MISCEILKEAQQFEIPTNHIVKASFPCLALVVSGALLGCSTTIKPPPDLPLRHHNAQYDFTFFLPSVWKGYTVRMEEWNAELRSADYQSVIGLEHGPMIVLRHPRWKADKPYQDIPILVFTRDQWEAVIPQRLFVGAGGTIDEISHSAKNVFAINSRHNWGELDGWQETERIVLQNMAAGRPHLYPDSP